MVPQGKSPDFSKFLKAVAKLSGIFGNLIAPLTLRLPRLFQCEIVFLLIQISSTDICKNESLKLTVNYIVFYATRRAKLSIN